MHKSMSEFYGVLDNLSVVNQNLQKHREELQKYVNELQNNVQKIHMDQDLRKRNTDIAKKILMKFYLLQMLALRVGKRNLIKT